MSQDKEFYYFGAVGFAKEVLDMQYELIRLREEVESLREYRDKYFDLLDSSIKHGEETMNAWANALIDGSITISK